MTTVLDESVDYLDDRDIEITQETLSILEEFNHVTSSSPSSMHGMAYKLPMLTAEQQLSATRDQRIIAYMRLVGSVTRQYRRFHFYDDLYQDGMTELVLSAEKYDPTQHNCSFATYAIVRIRSMVMQKIAIYKYPFRILTTKSLRLIYNNLSKYRTGDRKLSPEQKQQMSEDFGVDIATITDLETRMQYAQFPVVIDPISSHDDYSAPVSSKYPWEISDSTLAPETIIAQSEFEEFGVTAVTNAIEHALMEREQRIIKCRFLTEPPQTLTEIGKSEGISAERVRQIEFRAIGKMKRYLAEKMNITRDPSL